MSVNASNIRVAGNGNIWKAPVGSALPTDSTSAIDAAFKNIGFATDGFELQQELSIKEIEAWQSLESVRLIPTKKTRKVTFEAIETNTTTLALAYGGATVTAGSNGAYTLDLPSGFQTEEFSLVLDWNDGATNQRVVIPRATLASLPKITAGRQDAIKYGFEVQALTPSDNSDSVKIYGVDASIGA